MLCAQQGKNQSQSWETYFISLNILRTPNVYLLWRAPLSFEHDNEVLLREKTLVDSAIVKLL